jgi:hypothetical protein
MPGQKKREKKNDRKENNFDMYKMKRKGIYKKNL